MIHPQQTLNAVYFAGRPSNLGRPVFIAPVFLTLDETRLMLNTAKLPRYVCSCNLLCARI